MKKVLTHSEVIHTIAVTRDKPGKTADQQIVERSLDKALELRAIEPQAATEIVKHAMFEAYEPSSKVSALERFKKFFAPFRRTTRSMPSPSW